VTRNHEWNGGRSFVRIEEAQMQTRFIPRLLTVSLLLAFVLAGAIHYRAAASDRTQWSDTVSVENEVVQACYYFNVTGSYTADRVHQIVENYYNNEVFERQDVSFTGTLGNAATGKYYAYEGGYTRTANLRRGSEVIHSNLSLKLEVDTPNAFAVSVPYVDFELDDNPSAVIKALVPNMLHMNLCQLFGGSTIGAGPNVPSALPELVPSFDERAGKNAALPQWVSDYTEHPSSVAPQITTTAEYAQSVRAKALKENADLNQDAGSTGDMTPWTELDPCDTSPPGKAC
jgi:hypothetical protein